MQKATSNGNAWKEIQGKALPTGLKDIYVQETQI